MAGLLSMQRNWEDFFPVVPVLYFTSSHISLLLLSSQYFYILLPLTRPKKNLALSLGLVLLMILRHDCVPASPAVAFFVFIPQTYWWTPLSFPSFVVLLVRVAHWGIFGFECEACCLPSSGFLGLISELWADQADRDPEYHLSFLYPHLPTLEYAFDSRDFDYFLYWVFLEIWHLIGKIGLVVLL